MTERQITSIIKLTSGNFDSEDVNELHYILFKTNNFPPLLFFHDFIIKRCINKVFNYEENDKLLDLLSALDIVGRDNVEIGNFKDKVDRIKEGLKNLRTIFLSKTFGIDIKKHFCTISDINVIKNFRTLYIFKYIDLCLSTFYFSC